MGRKNRRAPQERGPSRRGGGSRQSTSSRGSRPVRTRAWDLDAGAGWLHYGHEPLQEFSDGLWHVRAVPGYGAGKHYRCPGCDQLIPPGVAHIVAWRADGSRSDADAEADRRHWHNKCWDNHAPRRR
ncbi:hypothetical protein JOD50_001997 [Pseudoglutamicibacter cumminsii]|nr:hypothetical protein [Pseudoglutamicibacter cumminsii]